ncbi:MAG: MinD/ParA family protein [Desulfobacteraceae bacterium]|nr:MAG: MinD/ParA family protein [Desulfobacteraceae bacterium]
MAHIISVHSFRGGTGKSNTAANLAVLYAKKGFRVGVLDTDIQSPGIHVLFRLEEGDVTYSLNDYLWGQCAIEQTAYDVTPFLKARLPGSVYLVPASVNASDIARVLHDGYDVNLLSQGYRELIRALELDALVIDTHPGLNEETLLSIALSSAVLVVMRPDHQDYQGTALTVDVARELDVPKMWILVNKVPSTFDAVQIRGMVENTYGCAVAAILPHSDEMMTLASQGLFAIRYPDHPITLQLQQTADILLSDGTDSRSKLQDTLDGCRIQDPG